MVFGFLPAQENYVQSEQRRRASPSDVPEEAKELREIAMRHESALGGAGHHDLNPTIYTRSLMQKLAWPETNCPYGNPNHK
jgi:hypothetical protein